MRARKDGCGRLCGLLILAASVAGCVTSQGPASLPGPVSFSAPDAPAASDPRLAALEAELAAANIRMEWPAGYPADSARALAEELVAGLHALPTRARAFPGGPLTFRLRAEPGPFGMGRGTEPQPEWEDGTGTFVLYAYEEPPERRALYRLEGLSPSERERLWRRRAVVHAIVRRWDDRLRWSRRAEWTRITGWQLAGSRLTALTEHPTNSYGWAYSRMRGMEASALDLATFAEEALVPAEALRDGATPIDDRLECQEFSKKRFLDARLAGLEGKTLPDPADLPARPLCPAFDRWADLANLEHVEVLLSAPSGQRPQSLFGHLMLRPVYGPRAEGSFEPVIEVAAISGFNDDLLTYVWKGTTGGYQNAFSISSVGAIRMEHVDQDQRTVRRFRLNLTRGERVRLMERLWELERRGYFPYYFFTDNCASFVAFAVSSALEGDREVDAQSLPVLPTGVLEALAQVEATDETGAPAPLLVDEPGDVISHRATAVTAQRRVDELMPELTRAVPASLAARWETFVRDSRSAYLPDRRRAHEALRALAQDTLTAASGDARIRGWVAELADCTVRMERYLAQLADDELRKIDQQRVQLPPGARLPTAEEVLVTRQQRYQREGGPDRILELLREYVRIAEFLEQAPRRAPTHREQERVLRARETRRNFIRLALAHGDVVEAITSSGGELSPLPIVSAAEQRFVPRRRASGLGRFALGLGAVRGETGATPVVITRSAFLRERLGERRERGLDSLTELRILDGQVAWTVKDGLPQVALADIQPLVLRSVPREPQVGRSSWTDWLGFGGGWGYTRDAQRELPDTHRVHAEALWVAAASPFFEQHLLFGVGPEVELRNRVLPRAAAVGPRAELSGRFELPTGWAHAGRLDATWASPWVAWGDGQGQWQHRAGLEAAVELDVSGGRGWMVELAAKLEVPLFREQRADPRGAATLVVEWP